MMIPVLKLIDGEDEEVEYDASTANESSSPEMSDVSDVDMAITIVEASQETLAVVDEIAKQLPAERGDRLHDRATEGLLAAKKWARTIVGEGAWEDRIDAMLVTQH